MSDNGKITHIGQLKHDKRNPRKHNPRNIGVVVNSLQQVGFARSIVIDENNEILAGNGVTEAAGIAGIEKVVEVEADGETIVAVRRRGLTDEQKQALKYYDNRSSDLAEWDLAIIVSDLELGLDLSNLWNPNEISELLEGAADGFLEVPDPTEQKEPELKAERFIEIYCSESDLRDFQGILDEWAKRSTTTVNIS